MKMRRKRKHNQGNSFIVVVATISFLAVLVSALLVAVALCFKLKAYDINSRDNFYYLEQAMDEIYEGVGEIAMDHLNDAYNETLESIVYYDTTEKLYKTKDSDDADSEMKVLFKNKLKEETEAAGKLSATKIVDTLKGFITNNSVGVELLDVSNVTCADSGNILTIHDVVLTRKVNYSTANTSKTGDLADPEEFVQSITTDIVIAEPDYKVSFTAVNDLSSLYEFAIIADMGVEVTGPGTKTNIVGNVYAASDFYNKDYTSYAYNGELAEGDIVPLNTTLHSYTNDELKSMDGIAKNSMYSGLYVEGANVTILADKVIVPGSIAALDMAKISVIGSADSKDLNSCQVWTDSIVMDGNSSTVNGKKNGSSIKMNAQTYVYDDLELNAAGSKFTLEGNYYGYSYSAIDKRKYVDAYLNKVLNGEHINFDNINGVYVTGNGGTQIHLPGQSHYNSSAIIVNGIESELNLAGTKNMYIAGQAYVELSKSPTTTSDVEEDLTFDTSIQDYKTGEALTIKSNQLAYIPPYDVLGAGDDIYIKWPASIEYSPYFKSIIDGLLGRNGGAATVGEDDMADAIAQIPVMKTEVSDQTYYFYDFDKLNAKLEASGSDVRVEMNEFMEEYAKLFETQLPQEEGEQEEGEQELVDNRSIGELSDLYDITEYQNFKVNDLTVVDTTTDDLDTAIQNHIYSNSAISVINGEKVKIVANAQAASALIAAKDSLKPNTTEGNGSDETTGQENGVNGNAVEASVVSSDLNLRYKEMKMLLKSAVTPGEENIASKAQEYNITPINYYFDFSLITDNLDKDMENGYKVIISKDDVNLSTTAGDRVCGIIICKGDVTFDDSVKEFEGIIVTGGKVIVKKSVNFVANPEVVKSVLRECDEKTNLDKDDSYKKVYEIFRLFKSNYEDATSATENNDIEPVKTIAAVQYEDMVSFQNWMKNVD